MALKDLIFHKPATRGVCIPSVLRFTYHSDNDVRTKAVRLASNLLWPDPAFQPTVEAFAKEVGYWTVVRILFGWFRRINAARDQLFTVVCSLLDGTCCCCCCWLLVLFLPLFLLLLLLFASDSAGAYC